MAAVEALDFEQIVTRYAGDLLGYARRMMGNREDGEEVVQDALVRAHRAMIAMSHRQRLDLRLKPWLYTITANVARNRLRKARPTIISLDATTNPDWFLPLDREQAGPEPTAEAHASLELIRKALLQLPAPLRETAWLRFVEGRSYPEIARVSGLPAATVKSQIQRATRTMRRILEPHVYA